MRGWPTSEYVAREMTTLNPQTMDAMVEKIHMSFAGAAIALMVHLGDRLGLYRILAEDGPMTPSELAERAGCSGRYVREWLAQQAVSEILTYDAVGDRFELPPEHALVLSEDETPTTFAGGFEALAGMFLSIDRVVDAFRFGGGFGWEEHDARIPRGTSRFFGASYRQRLVDDWVPALALESRLKAGARVADIGCGEGVSTVLLAAAFPKSEYVGIDTHQPSIEAAQARARSAGVEESVSFEVGDATSYEGGPFDVIWFFDCLHDFPDPVSALANARSQLADDGIVVLVEPFAAAELDENIKTNPSAALHYTASTFVCIPNSLTSPDGAALGAQAGPRVLADVLTDGGFPSMEQVAATPEHAVYAARPK
jgi:SAM-dependent methyltransferase